ncbi:MAG TPA: alpha/beta hydrolase [Acidimicrobiales bacterium]|nr:alpha/beta hydrolase [Acidimicrobiales bacterium]
MPEPVTSTVAVNGVELAVTEAGDGPLVVLCHGFPELAFSWRHQIPALAAAGYHVVAPDQRGYGASSRPEAIDAYDIVDLTDDIVGLIDHYGEDNAVVVGHDWGAPVVWNLAQRAPERVRGVVGMSVPHIRRAPAAPITLLKTMFGDVFFYILYFQKPGVADAELGASARTTMTRFLSAISGDSPEGSWRVLQKGAGFLDAMDDPAELPGWLPQADLDVFVKTFERTGFTGGLNWYRNIDRNWELSEAWADRPIIQPALFIGGEFDPVLRFTSLDGLDTLVPGLRGTHLLAGGGHWIQQEQPTEVNELLLEFLGGL